MSNSKTMGWQRLPKDGFLYWGRDRTGNLFISLAKRDPRSSDIYPLCHGGEVKVAWGAYSCNLGFSTRGITLGRIWIDW